VPDTHHQRVLLVFAGILRNFEEAWSNVKGGLIRPNEKRGYQFTIVFHTSLECACARDPDRVALATPGAPRLTAIQHVLGRYNFSYMDSMDTCTSHGHGISVHSYFNESRWIHCGMQHFASRSVQALDASMGQGQVFDMILVLRPDAFFATREYGGHRKLLLKEVCSRHPGISIISGRCDRTCTGFHWHDIDMAWLLCDGSKQQLFRDALFSVGQKCQGQGCDKGEVTPSSDFHPQGKVQEGKQRVKRPVPWSCDFEPMMCRTVQLLQGKVRFGNLDSSDLFVSRLPGPKCCLAR